MTSTNRNLGIIFIGAVIVRLGFNYLTGFIADDAFITFRYAENIAAGYGFVYNVGEKVMGTSTPLFTLILSLFAPLSIPLPAAALLVSLLSSGLTATIIYRFAQQLRFSHFAVIPAVCYILWPRSLPADTSGMETAFFTLLIIATFYYQNRQLRLYAVGMATLAAVTRPEGAGLLVLIMAANIIRDRANWRSYLLVPMVLIVPWLAFTFFYFGSPLPHAVVAKTALYSQFGIEPLWERVRLVTGFHKYYGYPLLAGALAGGWWLRKKQNYGGLEIIWMLGMAVFFILSPTRIFFWYIVPVYPVYLIFITASFQFFSDRLKLTASGLKTTSPLITFFLIIVLTASNYYPVINHRRTLQTLENVHRRIGDYLYAHTDPDDIIAAEDIGYMGYYSKRRILDRDGLISPVAVSYNRNGRYRDLIIDQKPDWLVCAVGSPISGFVNDSTFISKYKIETSFTFDALKYTVYSRLKTD